MLRAVLQTSENTDSSAARHADWPTVHSVAGSLNYGDRDTFQKYLEANFPGRLKKLDGDLQFRQRTGGFEFKKLEESTATRLTCIVKERSSDQFARAVLEVEDAPPHRVADFTLRGIPAPAEFIYDPCTGMKELARGAILIDNSRFAALSVSEHTVSR